MNKMFEDSVWQMQVGLQNQQINNLSWKWSGSNTEVGRGGGGGGVWWCWSRGNNTLVFQRFQSFFFSFLLLVRLLLEAHFEKRHFAKISVLLAFPYYLSKFQTIPLFQFPPPLQNTKITF